MSIWTEIAGTNLSAYYPSPVPPGSPSNIMAAWSSAAYDSRRCCMYVTGGGHNDYGGNEIYKFLITSGTEGTWSRVWGPSPNIPAVNTIVCGDAAETYADGNPCSRHTYAGLSYHERLDVFWEHAGSLYCSGGASGQKAWVWSPLTGTWAGRYSGTNFPLQTWSGIGTCYDTINHKLYVTGTAGGAGLWEYRYDTDAWTKRATAGVPGYSMQIFIPNRGWVVRIGNGWAYYCDVSQPGNSLTWTNITSTLSGCPVMTPQGPGLQYYPAIDRIIGWVGGSTVYIINPNDWTWTSEVATGAVPGAIPGAGQFGRFHYIPRYDVFFAVTTTTSNVFMLKMSGANARVSMSTNTWTYRAAPVSGSGCIPNGSGKHARGELDTTDNRIYFCGGDWAYPGRVSDSGCMAVFSYRMYDGTWVEKSPNCTGGIQPRGPDEVGWVWDSKRKVFWLMPGYFYAVPDACVGSTLVPNVIFQYNPVTGAWTTPAVTQNANVLGLGLSAIKDEEYDQIIQLYYSGSGSRAAIYDCTGDAWYTINIDAMTGSGHFGRQQNHAWDPVDRAIYAIEEYTPYHMYKFNVGYHTIAGATDMGAAPYSNSAERGNTFWNANHRLVMYPMQLYSGATDTPIGQMQFYTYNPANTGAGWTARSVANPSGHQVQGINQVYDPNQDVLYASGVNYDGTIPSGTTGGVQPYIFLYRYSGVTEIVDPPVGTPPEAPTGLRIVR